MKHLFGLALLALSACSSYSSVGAYDLPEPLPTHKDAGAHDSGPVAPIANPADAAPYSTSDASGDSSVKPMAVVEISFDRSVADYPIGSKIQITVKTPIAGELTLTSLDTNGVASVIVPSALSAVVDMKADEVRSFPPATGGYLLQVDGPTGRSSAVAKVYERATHEQIGQGVAIYNVLPRN
jgi:Domain of unknown function (DUF4384)